MQLFVLFCSLNLQPTILPENSCTISSTRFVTAGSGLSVFLFLSSRGLAKWLLNAPKPVDMLISNFPRTTGNSFTKLVGKPMSDTVSPKKRYLEGQIVQNMRGSHLQVRPLPDDLNKPSCGKSPGITWTKLALELPGSQQRHRYLGTLKKHSLGNPNNPVTPL